MLIDVGSKNTKETIISDELLYIPAGSNSEISHLHEEKVGMQLNRLEIKEIATETKLSASIGDTVAKAAMEFGLKTKNVLTQEAKLETSQSKTFKFSNKFGVSDKERKFQVAYTYENRNHVVVGDMEYKFPELLDVRVAGYTEIK